MDEPSLQPSNSFSQYGRFKKQGFHLAEGGTLDSSRTCGESHLFFSTGLRVKNSEEISPSLFFIFLFILLNFTLFYSGGMGTWVGSGGMMWKTQEQRSLKKSKGLYVIMVVIIKGKGSRVLVLFGYI